MKYKIMIVGIILLILIPNINTIESKSIDEKKIDEIFICFYMGRIRNLNIDGCTYYFESDGGV